MKGRKWMRRDRKGIWWVVKHTGYRRLEGRKMTREGKGRGTKINEKIRRKKSKKERIRRKKKKTIKIQSGRRLNKKKKEKEK